jgi:hypothetical protein
VLCGISGVIADHGHIETWRVVGATDHVGEDKKLSVAATTALKRDPILLRFRAALNEVYGPRNIERVVLFGSRAGGDARPDSDYDVAVPE